MSRGEFGIPIMSTSCFFGVVSSPSFFNQPLGAQVPGTFLLTAGDHAVAVDPDAMATLSEARSSAFWLPHVVDADRADRAAVAIPPGCLENLGKSGAREP